MKVENIPTHHRRQNNVSGATQASFRAKFKVTINKVGKDARKDTATVLQRHYVPCDVLLFGKILKNSLKNEIV